jgi:hypothetical protein
VIVLLVGCGGPADDLDPGSDTATAVPPAACESAPCVDTVAAQTAEEPGGLDQGGQTVVGYDDLVFVGAPGIGAGEGPPNETAHVTVFRAATLTEVGRWLGESDSDLTGASVAVTDLGADGVPDVVVGRPRSRGDGPKETNEGAVHLLVGPPSGDRSIIDDAVLSFYSPRYVFVGNAVAFADLDLSGEAEIVASGLGDASAPDRDGFVYAIEADLRGVHTVDSVERSIRGSVGFGETLAVFDGDLDGAPDLVVQERGDAIDYFQTPWTGVLQASDADGQWTAPDGSELGEMMATLGDVTGDGSADFALHDQEPSEGPERGGRVYMITGGDLRFGPVADLPIQVHGLVKGDAMGRGLASGDVDGDGAEDLVVGASGVSPGHTPGRVLVYRGPLSDGVLTDADAAALVNGEYESDRFGRALDTLDADGDAQSDIVVGAQGWPGGASDGKVYLLLGSDILP